MRPEHFVTDENKKTVEMLSGLGIRQEDIATNLDIDLKTLRKHYRKSLDEGYIKTSRNIAKSLYEKATKERDTTAMIWWTKARMGWKGEQVHELKGEIDVKSESTLAGIKELFEAAVAAKSNNTKSDIKLDKSSET